MEPLKKCFNLLPHLFSASWLATVALSCHTSRHKDLCPLQNITPWFGNFLYTPYSAPMRKAKAKDWKHTRQGLHASFSVIYVRVM